MKINVDVQVLKELVTIHRRVGVLLKGLEGSVNGTLQQNRKDTATAPKQEEGKGSDVSGVWLRDKKPDAQ